MFDGQKMGEDVVGIVRSFMERELEPLKAENESLKARVAALEARPEPEKGEPGEKGQDGADGSNGADGKDGCGIKDMLIDRDDCLIATMEDGRMKNLGMVVGKNGSPGQDGKDGSDGFGFDDMDACVLDDDRTIELCFRRGEEEKAFTFKWPTAVYRGVFRDGERYERGDMVTWAGSLWHCDQATKVKPGTDEWTLAAKKGRDGKDAK